MSLSLLQVSESGVRKSTFSGLKAVRSVLLTCIAMRLLVPGATVLELTNMELTWWLSLLIEKDTPRLRASSPSQSGFFLISILVDNNIVIRSVTPVEKVLKKFNKIHWTFELIIHRKYYFGVISGKFYEYPFQKNHHLLCNSSYSIVKFGWEV